MHWQKKAIANKMARSIYDLFTKKTDKRVIKDVILSVMYQISVLELYLWQN